MPDKYVIQRRTASGLENVAELPALEGGKIDLSWLPVVGSMGSAIIERGSNANGEYIRWADGTQICRSTVELTGLDIEPGATVFRKSMYTPPAAFLSGYYDVWVVSAAAVNNDSAYQNTAHLGIAYSSNTFSLYNTGNSGGHLQPGTSVSDGGPYHVISATIRVVAIGRWK